MKHHQPGIHIQSYDVITDEHGGSLEAWWGQATVHVKAQDGDMPCMVANELICSRLAAALGLPVLPGEVATHPDRRLCWATPQIKYAGLTPPPPLLSEIVATYSSTAAGALVFDCWVLNEDRHEDNFLFHKNLGMWLIDHENALAGRQGERFESLHAHPTPLLGYHCFRDASLNNDDVQYWVRHVRSVSEVVVDLALNEANDRGLITKARAAILKKVLIRRRNGIGSLVSRFVQKADGTGPVEQLDILA
ncbi:MULTISPECIES: hypothetical protein [Nocardia]|uniref:PI3K/PI4K catalytic domain-containing protein n=1 Tax=Nocardia nova TaxID=37330 RepID=A0A2T2Z866_9NOCA|nr:MULTISPECIES: hypothetical protein [Nocardia]PSR63952.1 hypothetical protein C8259_08860 [Nocardia nova]